MQVSMQQFEAAAQAALDEIPDEFQRYLENTVFIIEESSADGMHLENLTLEPRCAALDQGDAVRSDPMWDLSPSRVDRRRPSREALGDELLVARQHADIELACFDHSQPGHAAVLEPDQDERRAGRNTG